MSELTISHIDRIETVDELEELVMGEISAFKGKNERLGMVAGKITAVTKNATILNRRQLVETAQKLRNSRNYPIFTPSEVIEADNENRFGKELVHKLWLHVLKEGGVTDLLMLPGWEESKGASEEYDLAESLGMRIHYLP